MGNIGLIKKRTKIPLRIAKPAKHQSFPTVINDGTDHNSISFCGTQTIGCHRLRNEDIICLQQRIRASYVQIPPPLLFFMNSIFLAQNKCGDDSAFAFARLTKAASNFREVNSLISLI